MVHLNVQGGKVEGEGTRPVEIFQSSPQANLNSCLEGGWMFCSISHSPHRRYMLAFGTLVQLDSGILECFMDFCLLPTMADDLALCVVTACRT